MKQRTHDGLREVELESRNGGRLLIISIVCYPDPRPESLPESVHVFGEFGARDYAGPFLDQATQDRAMRIYRELGARSECLGMTNWETSSMALEIQTEGKVYPARLDLYRRVTAKGPNYVITAKDMQDFAKAHGFMRGKDWANLELIDWVSLKSWFETERQEMAEEGSL